jgi:myosin heavy subunit
MEYVKKQDKAKDLITKLLLEKSMPKEELISAVFNKISVSMKKAGAIVEDFINSGMILEDNEGVCSVNPELTEKIKAYTKTKADVKYIMDWFKVSDKDEAIQRLMDDARQERINAKDLQEEEQREKEFLEKANPILKDIDEIKNFEFVQGWDAVSNLMPLTDKLLAKGIKISISQLKFYLARHQEAIELNDKIKELQIVNEQYQRELVELRQQLTEFKQKDEEIANLNQKLTELKQKAEEIDNKNKEIDDLKQLHRKESDYNTKELANKDKQIAYLNSNRNQPIQDLHDVADYRLDKPSVSKDLIIPVSITKPNLWKRWKSFLEGKHVMREYRFATSTSKYHPGFFDRHNEALGIAFVCLLFASPFIAIVILQHFFGKQLEAASISSFNYISNFISSFRHQAISSTTTSIT